MSRAENRHHEERIKNKVKKYYSGWAGRDKKTTGRVAHTKTLCSCLACGNRRKFEGKTLQERKKEIETYDEAD